MFFRVGTSGTAGGNLESVRTECRALENMVNDVGGPSSCSQSCKEGKGSKDTAHHGLVMELLVATEIGFL